MQAIVSRGRWTGAVGFILAAMGSAVGLGNVWRFPYITGQYGGAAFILLYIGCVLAVGVPVMLAEFLIGRKTQRNAVGAFRTLRPGSPWVVTGWLGVGSGFVILSYYSVVGGWVLHYIYLAVVNSFAGRPAEQTTALFASLSANHWLQIFWLLVFMLLTIVIVARGISSGIEIGNKIMMPLLFILLVGLLIYALQTKGAKPGLEFLLEPQWQKLGPTAVLEALGQALFSLSLGMGAMITYGSYLSRETNLVRSAFFVSTGDTLVAILAGFVVFPLVFTFGLQPSAGPGLIFRTLPTAFAQLPGGYLVALAFFVLLAFAALTSAISLLEVVCAYFVDERGWRRTKASWTLGAIIFVLGIPSALGEQFLGFMDGIATNYLLPIGALLVAVFTGWALTRDERREEFSAGEISPIAFAGWSFLIRFISPVALVLIFLHQLRIF
ncbi:MAG TPA: sodium-dependent transporter [Candidatus Acidoferrales bacterium]|nr:sodium-dependent transporter [Candidatus Acidoferrales bacterium]